MERLYYRSTSIVDLQAELRERELLAASRHRAAGSRDGARRVTFLGSLLRRRPRNRSV
ncbi:MAG TPA: hypothetical protein VM253_11240 [Candidatus Limnocylindrales bacterium]|jgi:hypothetical protein|nr:hypothetical protein [Candidatus Limnocylindrales bacterium]